MIYSISAIAFTSETEILNASAICSGVRSTIETLLKKGALTSSQIAEHLDIPLSEVDRIAENISY